MRRREFITLIGSAAAALPLLRVPVARAQEAGRIYKLGVIAGPARQAPRIVAFFDELKGLGFVEGQNLQIVAGGFGLREDQYTEVVATVAKSAPDAILCSGDNAVRAIQEATHTVPIVGMSVDMVAAGFVRSFAPGDIVAVSSEEPHAGSVALRHDAEAVMLDLVNPIPTGRRFIGRAGQAWLDEVGQGAGTRTRQHTL